MERLDYLYVRSLWAFLAFGCDEGNALVLFEAFMAGALNFAVMRKEILAAGFGHDKAKPFVVVEPLHDANFCFQCKS